MLEELALHNPFASATAGVFARNDSRTLPYPEQTKCLDVSRSFAVVNAIAAAHTPAEIGTLLVRVADAFGFSSVFGGLVPHAGSTQRQIAPLTLVQHVPEDWARRYNARGYLFLDPVFHKLQVDPQPFSWSESYASCVSELDRKLVGGEAAAFGLTDGLVVPVKTLEERVEAVSFGGHRPAVDPDETAKLSFVANYAIGRFLQLHAAAEGPLASLTPREHECLLWSSEGKTEAEIAAILGVSASTVSKHIASARERLGAANKTHAVAVAIRRSEL